MNVYFHIDEIGRDAVIASALKKECVKRGIRLFYGNRLYTYRLIKRFLYIFDVIILPRATHLDAFKGSHHAWPKIIILPTEAIGRVSLMRNPKLALQNVLDKMFMEGDPKYVDKVTKFLLWGQSAMEPIKKYQPELVSKMHVVGHPRYDVACFPNKKLFKQKENIINVGIITRQGLLNDFMHRSVISCVLKFAAEVGDKYEYFNKKTGDCLKNQAGNPIDKVYLESSDIKIMLEIIQKLSKYENVRLFLKVHPREDRSIWRNFFSQQSLKVELAEWRSPFMHWVAKLDYVIGSASTTFYDSYVVGVQPICTSKVDKLRSCHLHEGAEEYNDLMPFVPQPSSVNEIVEIVVATDKKFDLNKNIKKVLNKETNYPMSENSISNIVDQCVNSIGYNKKKKCSYSESIYYIYSILLNVCFYAYRRIWNKKEEQGSTFLLNKRNRQYIDELVKFGSEPVKK